MRDEASAEKLRQGIVVVRDNETEFNCRHTISAADGKRLMMRSMVMVKVVGMEQRMQGSRSQSRKSVSYLVPVSSATK